jgi:hypothetical protein
LVEELTDVKVPLAALTPQRVHDSSVEMIVPVKDAQDRIQRRKRFLTQLGNSNATLIFETSMGRTSPTNRTKVVIVETCPLWTKMEHWKPATQLPLQAAKKWLMQHAKVPVVDVFNPIMRTTKSGTDILQVSARIAEAAVETARGAGGIDGVMCRPIMTEEEMGQHRVVWLPGAGLGSALKQKDRLEVAQGLIATERGFGIRVPASQHAEASALLLGDEAMDVDGEIWEIAGIPLSWSSEGLEEVSLDKWQWGIKVIRKRRQGKTRIFYVRAVEQPKREFYQLDEGLAVLRLAGRKPSAAPMRQQRWIPGGDVRNDVKWTEAWSDPKHVKSLFEKSAKTKTSAAFGGRASQAPVLPSPPVASQSNDIAEIVRAAVRAAMAPVARELAELRNEVG